MSERALTIKQPRADLIVAGVKDVENRTWPVPSTLPQWSRCALCGTRQAPGWGDPSCACYLENAAVVPDGPFPFRLWIHAGQQYADVPAWVEAERERIAWESPDPWVICRIGVLLGSVLVTGCHHADECMTGKTCHTPCHDPYGDRVPHQHVPRPCSRWAETDVYHWQLTDPQPLLKPIPMRGRQGLWTLPDVIVRDGESWTQRLNDAKGVSL